MHITWVLHGTLLFKRDLIIIYNILSQRGNACNACSQVFCINGYITGINSFANHIQQDVYSPPLQNLCNGIHARQDKREEQELRHQTYL